MHLNIKSFLKLLSTAAWIFLLSWITTWVAFDHYLDCFFSWMHLLLSFKSFLGRFWPLFGFFSYLKSLFGLFLTTTQIFLLFWITIWVASDRYSDFYLSWMRLPLNFEFLSFIMTSLVSFCDTRSCQWSTL